MLQFIYGLVGWIVIFVVLLALYYLWIVIVVVFEWVAFNFWKIVFGFFIFIILIFWLIFWLISLEDKNKAIKEKKEKEEKDKWDRDHKAHYLLYVEVKNKRRRDEYLRRQREQERQERQEMERQELSMVGNYNSWHKSLTYIQEKNINLQQEVRFIEPFVMELNIYDEDFTKNYSKILNYIDETIQKNEIK